MEQCLLKVLCEGQFDQFSIPSQVIICLTKQQKYVLKWSEFVNYIIHSDFSEIYLVKANIRPNDERLSYFPQDWEYGKDMHFEHFYSILS